MLIKVRSKDREIWHKASVDLQAPQILFVSRANVLNESPQRSISPITMSSEPTMAGTSAIRQPRHISCVTDRLQKQLLRARARQGIGEPSLTMIEAHLAPRGLGFQVDLALGELFVQLHRARCASPRRCCSGPSPGAPGRSTASPPASARRTGASNRPAPPIRAPADTCGLCG